MYENERVQDVLSFQVMVRQLGGVGSAWLTQCMFFNTTTRL